jgi:hypothetical protein
VPYQTRAVCEPVTSDCSDVPAAWPGSSGRPIRAVSTTVPLNACSGADAIPARSWAAVFGGSWAAASAPTELSTTPAATAATAAPGTAHRRAGERRKVVFGM